MVKRSDTQNCSKIGQYLNEERFKYVFNKIQDGQKTKLMTIRLNCLAASILYCNGPQQVIHAPDALEHRQNFLVEVGILF